MLRSLLLSLARRERFKKAALSFPPTRALVARFVPGETVAEALDAVRALVADGLLATVDHLGEDTTTPEQAAANTRAYLELLAAVEAAGLADRVEASVKLSALGQALPGGDAVAEANVRRILARADAAGTMITFDMEDHTTTDATLALLRRVRADYPQTGAVLQAYLHRTPDDCRALAVAGSRIRLCKGAYDEPASVAVRSREDVDRQFLACLRILMRGEGYPMVASHDPRMIEAALGYVDLLERDVDSFEFQMLYGVRADEQRRLAAAGHRVRVYVPYGQDWYGYFMRRLAERPANLLFFGRALLRR